MNPSQPEQAGIPLPPMPEQAPDSSERPAESLPTKPEAAPAVPTPVIFPAAPAGAVPLPTVPASDAAAAAATASLMTDDDLIEKEWVNKAKRIVEQTQDNPYKQSENLSVFKSDYLKQRYGKTIKLSQ